MDVFLFYFLGDLLLFITFRAYIKKQTLTSKIQAIALVELDINTSPLNFMYIVRIKCR